MSDQTRAVDGPLRFIFLLFSFLGRGAGGGGGGWGSACKVN